MTALSCASTRTAAVWGFPVLLGILASITLVRLVGLGISSVDLNFDEAQYWDWSRELAWGYFSKPPLIAWIVAAARHVCGEGEACIRAPAPVLYLGTSVLVYALARQLYDAQVAFFAALSVALAAGVAFSARIISTDVPLLFFWALALLAYCKLLAGDRVWAIVLGIALGIGLLAKYAMIYFLIGVALAAWLDADARRILRGRELWAALAGAALIVMPNVIWNAENGFVSIAHITDSVEERGIGLNPLLAVAFVASQFAVLGPVVFVVLMGAICRVASADMSRADRLMLAFAIAPLALMTATAFITRVNPNWAAPAFVSAIVVVSSVLIRREAWGWLALSLAIGVITQAVLLVGDARAYRLHLPWLANGDVYDRTLGWHELGDAAARLARRVGARTIVAERRPEIAALAYYGRDQGVGVAAWPRGPRPVDHFDLSRALNGTTPQPLLLLTWCASDLSADFASVEPLGVITAKTGPTTARGYLVFKLDGRRGPIQSVGRCR